MLRITARVAALLVALRQKKVAMAAAIKYWLPVVFYAIFIFLVSSVPGSDIPGVFVGQDIVFHILEYAIFAFLVYRALKGCHPDIKLIKRLTLVFVIGLIYALSDEFHQYFVPGRFASGTDVFYDSVGVLINNIYFLWRR